MAPEPGSSCCTTACRMPSRPPTARAGPTTSSASRAPPPATRPARIPGSSTTEESTMPAIHFRTTVDAPPEDVYRALATQDGLAGNWTDQLEVPEQAGAVARFGFGPDWAKVLELCIDALEPGQRVEWTPVGGFPGWVGTSIAWEL